MGDAGFVIGLAIGFTAARKQKPWSELSAKEKRLMIGLVALGVVALAAGIVVFLLVRS